MEKNYEGFKFSRKAKYSCNGITNEMDEYYHQQTGLEFVLIPSGKFMMGSNKYDDDEKPIHEVKLSSYLICKTQVTQGSWQKIMGNNPSYFKKGDNYPIENITWEEAQEFCRKTELSLPTEAQWEYACRGGSTTKWYFGNSKNELQNYAWYDENSDETHPVGQKLPNSYGLYDVSGNVWEWVLDWYEKFYSIGEETDPNGPKNGLSRVHRGGSWCSDAEFCRSSNRLCNEPNARVLNLGFRVCSVKKKEKER